MGLQISNDVHRKLNLPPCDLFPWPFTVYTVENLVLTAFVAFFINGGKVACTSISINWEVNKQTQADPP